MKTKRRPVLGWLPHPRLGSVQQQYVGIQAVREHVLELVPSGAGRLPELRSIITVSSINYALKSEQEQLDILEGFRAFLNGVTFDLHILVRVTPLDIRSYAARMRAAGEQAPTETLRAVAEDHALFVETLMARKTLLTRQFLIIVGADVERERQKQQHPLAQFGTVVRPRKAAQATYEQAQQQVSLRAETIERELERVGLTGRRLLGDELVQTYYAALTPQRAAAHPLSHDTIVGANGPSQTRRRRDPEAAEDDRTGASNDPYDDDEVREPPEAKTTKPPKPPILPLPWPDLADLVAPSSVTVEPNALVIDDTHIRTLAITGYPRFVNAGWLERLIDLDEPLDISLHLHPQDTRAILRQLNYQIVTLTSTQQLRAKSGKVTEVDQSIALSDIEQMRVALQRGDERFFAVAIYLCLRAPTRKALDERTTRVETACENLQLVTRSMTFEQDLAFLSCLPERRDRLMKTHPADTSTATMSFPFVSNSLSMQDGIVWGTAPNGSPIILDLFSRELENANTCIFAKSGAGKSYSCKITAARYLVRGVDVYAIDPEDEYGPVVQAAGGQTIYLSAGASQHINPFDLPVLATGSSKERGNLLADKIQSLHALMDLLLANRSANGAAALSQQEKGLIDRALNETYRGAGITADPATHRLPPPLMKDLFAILKGGECGPDETHLAERLYRYVFGSLSGMFAHPTNVELDSRFVCFSIRDMDAELRPLSLYLITEFVWTHIRRERRPRVLIIDEAWTLLKFAEGGRFLAELARRARKYYLGLITITQDCEDFLSNEHGRTILTNSSVQLLLRQDSSTIDAVVKTFRLSANERHFLLSSGKGEGLIFARQSHVGIKIEGSALEHHLATTDPRELAAREQEDLAREDADRQREDAVLEGRIHR